MTEARVDQFKGSDIFAIWDKEKESEYPIISFGLKKAKIIAEHYDELLQFIRTQENISKQNTEKASVVPPKSSKRSPKKASVKKEISSPNTVNIKSVPIIRKKPTVVP
jgi:hypothetical protein